MNYKKIIIAASMIALTTSSLFLSSCKKTKEALSDAEVSSVQDGATADGTSQEVQNLAEQAKTLGAAGMRTSSNCGMLSSCAVITLDTTSPSGYDTMKINFGSSPCICHDGRYRSGEMIVAFTGKYRTPNANINIGFNNYSVGRSTTDMYSISNSSAKHIVNNGMQSNGFYSWNVSTSMSITKPNGGGTISFTDTKVRAQIAGDPYHHSWTNKFDVSGSASGTAANGNSFTAQTASGKDLIRDMSCPKHFTQGELDITTNNNSIQIDFGNGACDNTATVTKNGVTRTITLR